MAGSDFSSPFIAGFGHTAFPARAGGALHLRSVARYPGSRARSVRACWGLRPRRTETPLAITRRPMLPSGCVTPSAPGISFFRGSMASLHDPLPTLRPAPRGARRTARGRCDSLRLHRRGLAPPTPCRSPGALRISGQSGNITLPLGRLPAPPVAASIRQCFPTYCGKRPRRSRRSGSHAPARPDFTAAVDALVAVACGTARHRAFWPVRSRWQGPGAWRLRGFRCLGYGTCISLLRNTLRDGLAELRNSTD